MKCLVTETPLFTTLLYCGEDEKMIDKIFGMASDAKTRIVELDLDEDFIDEYLAAWEALIPLHDHLTQIYREKCRD